MAQFLVGDCLALEAHGYDRLFLGLVVSPGLALVLLQEARRVGGGEFVDRHRGHDRLWVRPCGRLGPCDGRRIWQGRLQSIHPGLRHVGAVQVNDRHRLDRVQLVEAGVGHRRLIQTKDRQVRATGQLLQSGVGHERVRQIQRSKFRLGLEVGEPGPRHAGAAQVEVAELPERREMSECGVRDLRAAHGQCLESGQFGEHPHAVIRHRGLAEVEVDDRAAPQAFEPGVGDGDLAQGQAPELGQGSHAGQAVAADAGSGQTYFLQVRQVAQCLRAGVRDCYLVERQLAQALEIDQLGHSGVGHFGAGHAEVAQRLPRGDVLQAPVGDGRGRDRQLLQTRPRFERGDRRVRDRRAGQVKAGDGRQRGQMCHSLRAEVRRLNSHGGNAGHVLHGGQVVVLDPVAVDEQLRARRALSDTEHPAFARPASDTSSRSAASRRALVWASEAAARAIRSTCSRLNSPAGELRSRYVRPPSGARDSNAKPVPPAVRTSATKKRRFVRRPADQPGLPLRLPGGERPVDRIHLDHEAGTGPQGDGPPGPAFDHRPCRNTNLAANEVRRQVHDRFHVGPWTRGPAIRSAGRAVRGCRLSGRGPGVGLLAAGGNAQHGGEGQRGEGRGDMGLPPGRKAVCFGVGGL